LSTLRAEILLEGQVDSNNVSVQVVMQPPITNFSNAKRRQQTVYVSDRFRTNPGPADWAEAGELGIEEKERAYYFHCGVGGMILTDLGLGILDDFIKPVHLENTGRVFEDACRP
jgi:hypothetical protein